MITDGSHWGLGQYAAAESGRRLILEQHTELRRLLALGLVQTYTSSHDRQAGSAVLRALVARVRTTLIQHLRDEDAVLLPLFEQEPGGWRRAQNLRDEHARQRQEIEAMAALSEAGSADALAERFDGLARALLLDIAQEDRELARMEALPFAFDGRRRSPGRRALEESPAGRAESAANG
jgi:hypothetical protein